MTLRAVFENLLGRNAAPVPELVERSPDPAVITLLSIVFSTIPKTFDGPATFMTIGDPLLPITTTTKKTHKSAAAATTTAAVMTTPIVIPTTSTTPIPTTLTTSPKSVVSLSTTAAPNAALAASATASAEPSHGMSGGAKAGLAIGLLILFGLAIAGAIALYRRRKYQQENGHRMEDEKDFLASGRRPDALPPNPTPSMAATSGGFGAAGAAGGYNSNSSAPRTARFSFENAPPQLNVRTVSQFEPGFPNNPSGSAAPVKMPNPAEFAGAGAVAGAVGGAAAIAARNNASSPNPNVSANDVNNPFGNHAEKLSSSPPQDIPLPPSPVPSGGKAETNTATTAPEPSTAELAGGAGAAAIVAATAAAAANKPKSPVPGSSTGPEVVHRVQLDFAPSMEDELEIRAGQLVRILYEYDDGWALCMRMDRSQQGVVPRTCLSKHPVKPRPQSPNGPGPAGRRGPPPRGAPNGQPPRNGPQYAMTPRPLTPTGRNSPFPNTQQQGRPRANSSTSGQYMPYPSQRSQSPGPNGGSRLRAQESSPNLARRRSNSMGGIMTQGNLSTSALQREPGPSKIPSPVGQIPSRKPVPSQGSTASS